MRLIINCNPELLDAAAILLSAEMRDWERRYNKIGWGWTFRLGDEGEHCFVRRIKDGLSLSQIRRAPVQDAQPDEAAPKASPLGTERSEVPGGHQ